MKVAITDASVFFDLFNIEVLPEFFALDLEIYTTDFIYDEILRSEERELFKAYVRSDQLKVIVTDEAEHELILNMELVYSNNSFADRTAIYKAKQMKCTLLTCDEKLRKEAVKQNLEVYGSIWVIDEMIEKKGLNTGRAIKVLESLKITNAWLPIDEINERIRNLKNLLSG